MSDTMGTSTVQDERQRLERIALLRAAAIDLIQQHNRRPGIVQDYPSAQGFAFAFGYIEPTSGGGTRQRYIEVPLTVDDYLRMDDEVRQRVLAELERELEAL